jgi:hypothetical protein
MNWRLRQIGCQQVQQTALTSGEGGDLADRFGEQHRARGYWRACDSSHAGPASRQLAIIVMCGLSGGHRTAFQMLHGGLGALRPVNPEVRSLHLSEDGGIESTQDLLKHRFHPRSEPLRTKVLE